MNGETMKQLLARSIYLLYKKESLWTQSQRIRAEIPWAGIGMAFGATIVCGVVAGAGFFGWFGLS